MIEKKSVKSQAVLRACRVKQDEEKPVIGSFSAKKVVSLFSPTKRVITQKITIFYDENHNPIWVSYSSQSMGKIYKEWRDYCANCKILSIGDTRNHALSFACQIQSNESGKYSTVSLRQFNMLDKEFGCSMSKILNLSFKEAVELALNQGLNDLFGYSRKKEVYGDGIKVYHPSQDPVNLLKKLSKRVKKVVKKNAYGFFFELYLYGYLQRIYIDTTYQSYASNLRAHLA